MNRRLWASVMAAGVVAVAAVLIATMGTHESKSATVDKAPDWLQQQARKALAAHPNGQVQSVTWSKTTVGTYHDVVPDQGEANPYFVTKPLYVVVANGDFTETAFRGGEEQTVEGKQLLLVYDGETHQLSVTGTLSTPFDASKLGTATPLDL
jgi:surface antigen